MFKLGFIPVLIMGISVAVIIMSWAYFWNYGPDVEEAKDLNDQALALKKNADQLKTAENRLQKATDMVKAVDQQWRDIVAVKTPPDSLSEGGINMNVNAWQMTIDSRIFRNSIQKAINKQMKAGGVKVMSGPTVPMPSEDASQVVADFFNYPATPFPVVIFDLGQVTVQGTYNQIVTNMEAWTSMPNYLAVADGLVLTGTAPILTGTYNLSVVGYIRANVVYPTVQEAAASGGGGGFGGGARPGGGGRLPGGAPGMGRGPGGGPGMGRGPGGPGPMGQGRAGDLG